MDSWPQDSIYRRTASGDKAWVSNDPTVPPEYRRILAVIEGVTHSDVIRGLLRQFPDALLADWLSEMEELGLVISAPADPKHDLDFTGPFKGTQQEPKVATPDDTDRLERQALAACAALNRAGAYLSPDRLENRKPIAKVPSEIMVLVVEDDPDQAALANLRVSAGGYLVRIARNCKELVEEISAHPLPDLVLLDVILPDGNGFDVLTGMRRQPKLALLPVVMLTVLAKSEDVRRGLNLGADGYVTKPYSKRVLTEIIRSVLKHS
ncbi:MAG: response regulator transcription factor [Rudaea sp.]